MSGVFADFRFVDSTPDVRDEINRSSRLIQMSFISSPFDYNRVRSLYSAEIYSTANENGVPDKECVRIV